MGKRQHDTGSLGDDLDFDWGRSGMPEGPDAKPPLDTEVDFEWGSSGMPNAPKSLQAAGSVEKGPGAVERVHAQVEQAPDTLPQEVRVERELKAREREDWFRRLPRQEQERLRERWRWEAGRFGEWGAWERRLLVWAVRDGTLTLGIAQFLQFGSTWPGIGFAAACGTGLGFAWHRMAAGRFLRVATAVPLYFLLQLTSSSIGSSTVANPSPVMFLLYGGLAVSVAAAVTGLIRERQEQDGPSG